MDDWELKIKKVNNGYIIKGKDNDQPTEHVIEEGDGEFSELEAMKNVLWDVKEYFAVFNSKHNKCNLIIEIEENKD